MKIRPVTSIMCVAFILGACSSKDDTEASRAKEGRDTTAVYADDSLVWASWWDTGEGGTAPAIDAVVRFKTSKGTVREEHRPLLKIVHPDDDYSHHEVDRITCIDTDLGEHVYFFFLSAKEGSNEFSHDIVAFTIEGDSLSPYSTFILGDKPVADVPLKFETLPTNY